MLGLLSLAATTYACGPFFPNNLLSGGDEALFSAPVANFRRELERLNLAPCRFDHVAAANGHEQQTFDAELADLAAALKKAKVPGVEAAMIIAAHRKNRDKLQRYRDEHDTWESQAGMDQAENAAEKRGPEPEFPSFITAAGLPGEFADYFEGVVAWRSPKPNRTGALQAWERLLERPASERSYKSTWAAYMLGKLWEPEDDDKAVAYFQMTRALAQQRFADSAGLAVAAIGWEARVELRRNHFKRAMQLYLEQHAAGDDSAGPSLNLTARGALQEAGADLVALAALPNTRAVITAYLISAHVIVNPPTGEGPARNEVTAWLEAVEAAKVTDLESVERLALAAYQGGEFALAERWIKRARNSPVAQWLQAKLYLRAGKIPQAATLLAKVTRELPVVPPDSLTNSMEFADALRMRSDSFDSRPTRQQLLGELGVLALSRGDFEQALDALLRAGFWEDAAYVAERGLTVAELKRYVDREWPAAPTTTTRTAGAGPIEADSVFYDAPPQTEVRPEQIRHLLARRLAREFRGREAQPYFPPQWQARGAELWDALDAGWNEAAPAEQRAQALYSAAKIVRAAGMELLGTELAPDWFIHDGSFDWGLTWKRRQESSAWATVNFMTETELVRAARHRADPEQRFHYRYQAAFLAWEAAKLLPNDSAETARLLCTAGTWLKNRDPETADLFYKALVQRCRKTDIGAQADRMRWFPVLDEAGNPKPYQPQPEPNEPVERETTPTRPDFAEEMLLLAEPPPFAGSIYVVQRGDTFSAIAEAATTSEHVITIQDLAQANPDMTPSQLRVGQRIFIPAPPRESQTNPVAPDGNLGIAPDAPIPLPSAP